MQLRIGEIEFISALDSPELLAPSIKSALENWTGKVPATDILVAQVDPAFSDTEAFAARYGYDASQAANCLIVEGKRSDTSTFAACLVPAHARADINGLVRRQLGARRVSMASREVAVSSSGQEFGSITALGLPPDWPILIDPSLLTLPHVLVGGGLRRSKLIIPGAAFAQIPGATFTELIKL